MWDDWEDYRSAMEDDVISIPDRAKLLLKRKAWGSRSGPVLIADMSNYHLSQAIAWLEKNAEYPLRVEFLKLMFKEQLKRWREEGS